MPILPDRVNLDHLRKQAKALLRALRDGEAEAIARFRRALPAAAGLSDEALAALRLHDAQSCLARDYGFVSWTELKSYAEAQGDGGARQRLWLARVYAGDVTGSLHPARPGVAARMLAETPELAAGDPWLACAIGDGAALRRAIQGDSGWVNRPGGPLHLPPLVAVTHSSLLRLPAFAEALRDAARLLLAAGADPNQRIGNRFPPASLTAPDATQPLSTLYGAAGQQRDVAMTRLLLEAGADPDDGESLYHALESPDCTRLLLAHGARIPGTNAMFRALDLADPTPLELLLAAGGDAREPARNPPLSDYGSPLLWAIRRRRSPHHVAALLAAGADPRDRTPSGISAWRLAMQFGLAEVAALLAEQGAAESLTEEEAFLAACARADEAAARAIAARRPDLPAALAPGQLRLLPDLAAEGADAAVRLMVGMGWPIAVPGGDWHASALNLAVFRGDAALARFLLAHGAHWTERHGHGDDVRGTLSWASVNEPVEGGDWPGCAQALRDHGLPPGRRDPAAPGMVVIEGRGRVFSEDVAEILLGEAD
jgi:ankyrin repeat protein